LSVVLPLFWYEIKRTFRPVPVLALVGFCMILVYEEAGPYNHWSPEYAAVQGALASHNDWLLESSPLIAGLVGSSLADEQRRGIMLTFLSRGVTRGQYLLSKILGAAVSGALITAAAIVGFYILVGILWPWGRVTYDGGYGPVPTLRTSNPLANDLLGASMCLLVTAAMALESVLVGTLTSNRYIAMAAPLLLMIASVVFMNTCFPERLPFAFLNLCIQQDVFGAYGRTVPVPLQPYAGFVYWPCFATALAVLARWIFLRKELT